MAPRIMSSGALGERTCSEWMDKGGGHPLPPTRISVIEPYMQGYPKDNRLIDSIDSIV